MNLVHNYNQNNINFEARFRLKKKKSVKVPLILSSLGVWSTGAVSGYGFGHYGKDVFKPSFAKAKTEQTVQKIDSEIKNTKNNIEQKTKDVKEFFNNK